MKISGFTFIKNAVSNDYPIIEAINSILPIVDEMIVLVGDCTDGTLELIKSIENNKVKIHHSVWNKNLRSGGAVLADETNKALQLISKESIWAFYIQADEVVHEKYHSTIIDACKAYADNSKVEGLLFKYVHFYGTYDYVGDSRKWYQKEIRIIRNNINVESYKDAQGFRKNDQKLFVKEIDAYMYHYGWVKSPEQMMKKNKNFGKLWHDDESLKKFKETPDYFDYTNFDSISKFKDTHPNVMLSRIEKKNWQLELDTNKKRFSLKNLILYYIEKRTGIRLFDYKNYKRLP
ncbi:MAG: glycosyltransferase family 2 protein [Chitinophagaceae bacterium]